VRDVFGRVAAEKPLVDALEEVHALRTAGGSNADVADALKLMRAAEAHLASAARHQTAMHVNDVTRAAVTGAHAAVVRGRFALTRSLQPVSASAPGAAALHLLPSIDPSIRDAALAVVRNHLWTARAAMSVGLPFTSLLHRIRPGDARVEHSGIELIRQLTPPEPATG
jgi:hypothetical protein